jgi:hypothetical protein
MAFRRVLPLHSGTPEVASACTGYSRQALCRESRCGVTRPGGTPRIGGWHEGYHAGSKSVRVVKLGEGAVARQIGTRLGGIEPMHRGPPAVSGAPTG